MGLMVGRKVAGFYKTEKHQSARDDGNMGTALCSGLEIIYSDKLIGPYEVDDHVKLTSQDYSV